ncbi:hypothetical protein HAX54_008099 [Datura stramonium]|uniref:Uncharacterized protein n=1 Tax=Datura stramonium TaxID=4076 RepID=A0ABS8TCQ4_DATST|nr:hypothetical protein [Datura stramonium]
MESQEFKNPEKTRRTIHEQLRDCQFPLFECKVIVDELIKLALKYSNRSIFFDDHYVLRLGFKFDMSHRYQKLKENVSKAMATTYPTKSFKLCEEYIFGGSHFQLVIKMPRKHMFHFNCMKNFPAR